MSVWLLSSIFGFRSSSNLQENKKCCLLKVAFYQQISCPLPNPQFFLKQPNAPARSICTAKSSKQLNSMMVWKLATCNLGYRISSYSFRGNYSFLNLEIQRSQYIRPKDTVHKGAETIQGRKLYEEIRYTRGVTIFQAL